MPSSTIIVVGKKCPNCKRHDLTFELDRQTGAAVNEQMWICPCGQLEPDDYELSSCNINYDGPSRQRFNIK